ncbi:MAG: hypothetical protein WC455_24230 [Dehalococcoidia bacterium]|jgi:hypothetical protein
MAMTVKDLVVWLVSNAELYHTVGIDEGGLTLTVVETGEYIEVGGFGEVKK